MTPSRAALRQLLADLRRQHRLASAGGAGGHRDLAAFYGDWISDVETALGRRPTVTREAA